MIVFHPSLGIGYYSSYSQWAEGAYRRTISWEKKTDEIISIVEGK
jgi:hypothetical protein